MKYHQKVRNRTSESIRSREMKQDVKNKKLEFTLWKRFLLRLYSWILKDFNWAIKSNICFINI